MAWSNCLNLPNSLGSHSRQQSGRKIFLLSVGIYKMQIFLKIVCSKNDCSKIIAVLTQMVKQYPIWKLFLNMLMNIKLQNYSFPKIIIKITNFNWKHKYTYFIKEIYSKHKYAYFTKNIYSWKFVAPLSEHKWLWTASHPLWHDGKYYLMELCRFIKSTLTLFTSHKANSAVCQICAKVVKTNK